MGESTHRHMDRTLSKTPERNTTRAVILGAGNVATHLATSLSRHITVAQIYNHHIGHAKELAEATGACATDDLSKLTDDADIYIISVKDDAIMPLASALGHRKGLWVHTSGSVPMSALQPITETYGVLYPMQTFSKSVPVDMSKVPIFIEGSTDATQQRISSIASLISPNVYTATSEQRALLHVAAVFACNFTNYLWGHCADILKRSGLGLDIMKPLIEATLEKAMTAGPKDGQTGPARRNDRAVIEKHLSMLDGEAKDIYAQLSKYIIDKYSDPQ
ncbi:DUF2520 domain-containing protein [bacterium J10(2018)]|nr:DUF2520 domain-containing protein [Heminiphilus faecis]RLT76590.1 DUF2520 domain-containing protein [bacterium J10(2018)]